MAAHLKVAFSIWPVFSRASAPRTLAIHTRQQLTHLRKLRLRHVRLLSQHDRLPLLLHRLGRIAQHAIDQCQNHAKVMVAGVQPHTRHQYGCSLTSCRCVRGCGACDTLRNASQTLPYTYRRNAGSRGCGARAARKCAKASVGRSTLKYMRPTRMWRCIVIILSAGISAISRSNAPSPSRYRCFSIKASPRLRHARIVRADVGIHHARPDRDGGVVIEIPPHRRGRHRHRQGQDHRRGNAALHLALHVQSADRKIRQHHHQRHHCHKRQIHAMLHHMIRDGHKARTRRQHNKKPCHQHAPPPVGATATKPATPIAATMRSGTSHVATDALPNSHA